MKSITIIGFLICVLTSRVRADPATEAEEDIKTAFKEWISGDLLKKIPFTVPPIEPLPVPPFCDNIDKLGVKVYIETGLLQIFGLKSTTLDKVEVAKAMDWITIAANAPELRIHSDNYRLKGKALYVYNVKGAGTLDIKLLNVKGHGKIHLKPTSTGTEIDKLTLSIEAESAEGNLQNASWPINNLINTRGRQLVAAFHEEIQRVGVQQVDKYFREPLSKIKFNDLPQYLKDVLAGKKVNSRRYDSVDNTTIAAVERASEDTTVSDAVGDTELTPAEPENSPGLQKLPNGSAVRGRA